MCGGGAPSSKEGAPSQEQGQCVWSASLLSFGLIFSGCFFSAPHSGRVFFSSSGRIVGRLGTDQDRARYLAGYMQEAGDSEAWQGIYKAMEFDDKLEEQWRSLPLNMDRLAVLLAGVVQNRSKGEGQEAVTLQRLLKACHAQSWCDINYGVASALMNSIPALFDEEDLDSEQAGPVTGASPQGNDVCEFERQEMERQRMFDARALEVKVDTYAPVSSDENDHYVGDMEAVADGDVVYFDRVNPVALDALGSLQISKVHRTVLEGFRREIPARPRCFLLSRLCGSAPSLAGQ